MKVFGSLVLLSVLGAAVAKDEPVRLTLKRRGPSMEDAAARFVKASIAHAMFGADNQEFLSAKLGGENDPEPDSATIVLRDFMNASYQSPLTIGGQEFEMIFDTGSSNTWVPSLKCGKDCESKNVYDSSKSKEYVEDGAKFDIAYGSGPVSGFWSKDSAQVGSMKIDSLEFAEVTEVKGLGMMYKASKFDGICGMGFPTISVDGKVPLFEKLVQQGNLKEQVFTFLLGQQDGQDGELTFGTIDKTRYHGDIHWAPVLHKGYWTIGMQNVQFGSQSIGKAFGIVDSGTSLITGPSADVQKIADSLGAWKFFLKAGTYIVNCRPDKMETYPNLDFVIEGKNYSIPPQDYLIPLFRLPWFGEQCLLSVMAMDIPAQKNSELGMWILGSVFMRKQFTIFDYTKGSERVGFANPALEVLPPAKPNVQNM
eukprot:GDKI01014690.1.p1 GENE.GDKI01014690.1~~GDKI01014690.1.p1  ORF type:complete len:424 (-),score=166.37 GDKI01014690.1:277-1548(-)